VVAKIPEKGVTANNFSAKVLVHYALAASHIRYLFKLIELRF
jgi:hypothetical protein